VSKNDHISTSIENTNNVFHFGQDNLPDNTCLGNNTNDDGDEIAYPLNKIIKLKHDAETTQGKETVQYTGDIIVEVKNRYCAVVPMIALIITRTTYTIILRECVQKGRSHTSTEEEKSGKHFQIPRDQHKQSCDVTRSHK
jgi:hypothetical protein